MRTAGITFLSTPSVRRATVELGFLAIVPDISIHALREEGDKRSAASAIKAPIFLSTPSARRATWAMWGHWLIMTHISIHALREEGDCSRMILVRF